MIDHINKGYWQKLLPLGKSNKALLAQIMGRVATYQIDTPPTPFIITVQADRPPKIPRAHTHPDLASLSCVVFCPPLNSLIYMVIVLFVVGLDFKFFVLVVFLGMICVFATIGFGGYVGLGYLVSHIEHFGGFW